MPIPYEIECIKRHCKHFQPDKLKYDERNKTQPFTFRCSAFPNGIPEDIRSGKNKHTSVLKNQTGEYTYEKEKEER